MRAMRKLGCLTALLLFAGPAGADTAVPKAATPPGQLDLSDVKDKLRLFTDGKKHYVAMIPFGEISEHLYYGDGKNFYAMRVQGGGASGREQFSRTFWDPRLPDGYKRSVGFKDGKYSVQCDERVTALTPVPEADAKAMIGAAAFFPARWQHRAYALARDDKGNYYYVDKLREPENNKAFRLYAGLKGKMKLQKMTNVVSDSEGDMFATRTGGLRLIMNKGESTWIAGKARTKLLLVPVEDNGAMIYSELGVYTGQPLGTPCDDL